MKKIILIYVLFVSITNCHAGVTSCLDSVYAEEFRPLVSKLCNVTVQNHEGMLLVRTEFGLIAVPDVYVVNTLWKPGLLLQVEMLEPEDHGDESPFLSSIRFRSKKELEPDFFSGLIEVEGHKITRALEKTCNSKIKVFRGRVENKISNGEYEFTFVDFGGFVMSALTEMEQLFVAMAWAMAELNCNSD